MTVLFASILVCSLNTDEARSDAKICGLNSLYLVARYLDEDKQLGPLEQLLPTNKAPFSMAELDNAARSLGFNTSARHFMKKESVDFPSPAILHLRIKEDATQPDHFLACFGENSDGLIVAELPQEPFVIPRYRLLEIWDGDILYISNRPGFAKPTLVVVGLVALLVIVAVQPRLKLATRNNGGEAK